MKKVVLGILSMGIVLFAGPAAFAQKSAAGRERKTPAAHAAKGSRPEKKTPSTQGTSGAPQALDAAEAAEVQKYSDALTRAGLPPEDVKALVAEETQERLAKKQQKATGASTKKGPGKKPAPGASPLGKAAGTSTGGLASFVQALLKQGLRGRELADAIHAEQKRRQGAHDSSAANVEGSGHDVDPAGHPGKPEHGAGSGSDKATGHPVSEPQGGHEPVNGASGNGSGGPEKRT